MFVGEGLSENCSTVSDSLYGQRLKTVLVFVPLFDYHDRRPVTLTSLHLPTYFLVSTHPCTPICTTFLFFDLVYPQEGKKENVYNSCSKMILYNFGYIISSLKLSSLIGKMTIIAPTS